ncbi:MAG TPA: mechanosensitive ion channel family protein [Burkholderiales bacterium]|nr:mechanosensitive ion channel family protein [Burkholderiales bacterium]
MRPASYRWITPMRLLRSLLLAVLAVACAAPLPAEETASLQSTPVVIANRTIIRLRGPIAGYSAAERAADARQRIEEALEVNSRPEISFSDFEGATRVLVGGKHAFLVTKADIDAQAGETTQFLAHEAGQRLELAFAARQEQASPRYLAVAAALAFAATVAYVFALWLLHRAGRWLGRLASAMAERHAKKLQLRGATAVARRIVLAAAWIVTALVTIVWLAFVLERFPYTRTWGEHLASNLFNVAWQIGSAILGALPGLFLVAVIFLLTRALIAVATAFFDRVADGRIRVRWLDADTVKPTRRIFSFVVWVFALAMAYPYLPGAQTEAFKGLSVLVGVMISLGGASAIGQAFSGLILMYLRAFRSGDYVRIGETEGTVVDLGMFATRIRTGLGEEIILPNATVMTTSTTNFSSVRPEAGFVIDTRVTVGYSTPWRQVQAMLEEAAARTPDIAADPAPFVRQTALSDFYVAYRLVAHTPVEGPDARVDVLSQLNANILDVFNEHGVQIMSPHYFNDPAHPQIVPKDKWFAAPARPPESQQPDTHRGGR